MGELLVRGAVPVAVFIAFALLRRYLPPSRKKRRGLDAVPAGGAAVYGSMILIDIAFVVATYEGLLHLNHVFATLSGPAAFCLFPDKAMWWFFPLFGALTLGWELTDRIWTAFGAADAFAAYAQSTYEQAGFDSGRACLWLAAFLALPIGVASLLATPMHTAVRSSGIDVAGFASLHERHYDYSAIRRLAIVTGYLNDKGELIHDPKVLCWMETSQEISFSASAAGARQADPELISYLQSKIAAPAEFATTEDALPRTATPHGP